MKTTDKTDLKNDSLLRFVRVLGVINLITSRHCSALDSNAESKMGFKKVVISLAL